MTKLKYSLMIPIIVLGCLFLAWQMPATSRPQPNEGRTSPTGDRKPPNEGRRPPNEGSRHPSEEPVTPIFNQSYAQTLKLRSPIRTITGQAMCICPYDEIAQIPSGNQASLITTTNWDLCGSRSEYSRTGGKGASCYITDSNSVTFNGTQITSEKFANLIENWCNNNPDACHLDESNRY